MGRKLASLFLLLTSMVCLACCPSSVVSNTVVDLRTPEQVKRDLIESISKKTVALVKTDEDGDEVAYCAGVWLTENELVTANHCLNEEESDKLRVAVHEDDKNTLSVKVKSSDMENDIAILEVKSETVPPHPVAELSLEAWQGQHVNILGHTGGMPWTYLEGVLSSVRTGKSITGKRRWLLQVSSPAWFGNSGGGVWDDKGRLMGISSLISGKSPNVGFFVHIRHVKDLASKTSSQ